MKSPVFRPTSYCLARVVRPLYTITGCSAVVQRTHPCVGSLWLNFVTLPSRQWPKPDGSPIVYRFIKISYRRRRILFAAFDTAIRMMSPRSSRPAGPAASYFSPAPRPRSLLYNGRSHVAPVSLELPRFADENFVQTRIQSVYTA